MNIPMVDLAPELAALRADIDAAIARVLDSARFIGGPELEQFEAELAPVAGAAYAVGVSSGTDALLVALMALGVGAGDEVVTTPLSFFATAGAVLRLGARPVFADVDEDSLNLDPDAALAACSDRTKVILPVHLYGRPARLPEPARAGRPDLADLADLAVVEDAAQSLGASPVTGACQCVSFFPTKNLGALGDAGAVLTNDPALADRIRLLRAHGGRPKYVHIAVGGNFRLDALQAAVLRVKLPHLETWSRARRDNARRYRELFAAAAVPPELRLPADHAAHIYHQFVIRAPRRDELRAALRDDGVATEIYYPVPFHRQPCLLELGYREGAFPVAEAAAREVLALPIYPSLGADAQAYVVDRIAAFYAR
ncbi:DegT/DnrJ/EryC1/StrS family aminotransferase [Haliangium sp.]|uniref:DegT/DnrJ/EryC1/StrS family aminotransferase n=1 Tax=Haliangium sp. TaxID=2663208 RepID=UPI003D13F639